MILRKKKTNEGSLETFFSKLSASAVVLGDYSELN